MLSYTVYEDEINDEKQPSKLAEVKVQGIIM